VPIAESYALYHALKDNGTVVKFLAIPVAGYFPGDRTPTKEILSRWIGWGDQYLGGKAPTLD
jgi:hypothetical protein